MQKRARRGGCSCRNNAVDGALERQGLDASFEGYYTFVEALDVVLSEVKKHTQPYLIAPSPRFFFSFLFTHVSKTNKTINSKKYLLFNSGYI